MNKLRITSLLMLVTSVMVSLASTGANPVQPQPTPGKSYLMVSIESSRQSGGEVRPLALRARLVKGTGEWSEEIISLRTGNEGRKQIVYNRTDGQYLQSPQTDDLKLVNGFSHDEPNLRSPDLLRNHREFVRTESLLGFTTYVLRAGSASDYIEQHYAPDVGSIPIKLVMHYSTGLEQVIEAVQIEFRPVGDDEMANPNVLAMVDFLNSKIEEAERSGQMAIAQSLRKVVFQAAANSKGPTH